MIRPEERDYDVDDYVGVGMIVVLIITVVGTGILLALVDPKLFLVVAAVILFVCSVPVLGYIGIAILINVGEWRKDEL